MSKKLTTKQVPDIVSVAEADLSYGEKFMLLHRYEYGIGRPFVICARGRETILINKDLPDIEETIQLIDKIMTVKYLDKAENLYDQFEKLHGKDVSKVLLYIWMDWREEIKAVELNKHALDALSEIKRSRLTQKARKEKDMISELFSIGFGTYDDGAKCDWNKGKEYTFLYGYLQGMKAAEAKKARAAS